MIVYLQNGWYAPGEAGRLHDAVVDGALDSASMFCVAAVPPEAVSSIALKVHTVASLTLPSHSQQSADAALSPRQRRAIAARLQAYTDQFPALQSFVSDIFDSVASGAELRSLYLHLMHIAQVMQVLRAARADRSTQQLGLSTSLPYKKARGASAGTTSKNLSAAARAVIAQIPGDVAELAAHSEATPQPRNKLRPPQP